MRSDVEDRRKQICKCQVFLGGINYFAYQKIHEKTVCMIQIPRTSPFFRERRICLAQTSRISISRLRNKFHHPFISETSISTCMLPHGRVVITYCSLSTNMRRHVSLYSFIVTLMMIISLLHFLEDRTTDSSK